MTRHLLVRGDSLECAEWFARKKLSVQLIVTSPPYNANMSYGASFDDRKPTGEFLAFLRRFLQAADAVLDPGCYLAINTRDTRLPHGRRLSARAFLREQLVDGRGYDHVRTVTWQKGTEKDPPGKRERWPDTRENVRDGFELVFFFRKPGARREAVPIETDGLGVEETWSFPPERPRARGAAASAHPCPFPVELPARVIAACSHPGDRVFDPFGGTATTSLAAALAGRDSISMELSADFAEGAYERLRAELSQRPGVVIEREDAFTAKERGRGS